MIQPGSYYHVTHVSKIDSIALCGIDPSYSEGKKAECWYVSGALIVHAIIHVAARHNWLIGNMIVLEVDFHPHELKHSAWEGVYSSPLVKFPHVIRACRDYAPDWKEL